MMHLTKSIRRTVVVQDFDFRKTGYLASITVAPEGIYFRRPRQPQRCAILCPWPAAYNKAGELRAAQLHAERVAKGMKRKPRKVTRRGK